MSRQSLLLPRSTLCGDPQNDPRSSKEIRFPSIGQWDSFKVVIAAPELSPLPNSIAEELPMHHGPEKATKKKKPGYFWGMKHKYWIYIMHSDRSASSGVNNRRGNGKRYCDFEDECQGISFSGRYGNGHDDYDGLPSPLASPQQCGQQYDTLRPLNYLSDTRWTTSRFGWRPVRRASSRPDGNGERGNLLGYSSSSQD